MSVAVSKGSCARARRALFPVPTRALRVTIVVAVIVGAAGTAQLALSAQIAVAAEPAPETLEEALARDQARVRAVQERMAPALETSRRIAREVEKQYRAKGADLAVPEIALTVVVETIELAPGLSRPARSMSAENGIWFAICRRPPCALRLQRVGRELALVARRQALELALRTLEETSADLVVVALPRRWVATNILVLARDELLADDDSGRALRSLGAGRSLGGPEADEAVRGRLYVNAGPMPYSRTRDSLLLVPLERAGGPQP